MIKLILPSGDVKENFVIRTKSKVGREKSRIIAEAQVMSPLEKDLRLVALLIEGKELELMDDNDMKMYIKDLSCCSGLELRDKNSSLSSGFTVNPEIFGCKMRSTLQ
ncbi:hypothetical protein Bpfe_029504 [Biomphalaria pfeifferi]|uniref:Uncharacterized protein n=1 Tax=Biomphalaria pfeifferi TaxID=112525 RepID=A0AAD8ARH6_BIOPF|nr:hypothetical protein Bpfe_029504 [Biomphalaria pfeifferi]